ncbi:MAG TPA: hypothetical protein VFT41_09525, partial [Gemmatimonadaceae bacterium]|nr:hypothetical protein [Gemmatimonadaceae bacterium]
MNYPIDLSKVASYYGLDQVDPSAPPAPAGPDPLEATIAQANGVGPHAAAAVPPPPAPPPEPTRGFGIDPSWLTPGPAGPPPPADQPLPVNMNQPPAAFLPPPEPPAREPTSFTRTDATTGEPVPPPAPKATPKPAASSGGGV